MRWFPALVLALLGVPLVLAGRPAGVAAAADGTAAAHEASAKLVLPDGAPQADAHGSCDVRDGTDFQRFRIVVEGVRAESALDVYLGDGHESLVKVGEMPSGARGRTFTRSTLEGGELPFGAASVKDLAERRIEIRDGESHVVLKGNVPVIHEESGGDTTEDEHPSEPRTAKATFHRTEHAGEHEPRGVIVATKRDGSSALVIEVGRLAAETGYVLAMGSGEDLQTVGDFRTSREGGARYERDTAKSQELPLGADSVDGLAGDRVEVRTLDGVVLLYGEVPSVERAEDVEPVHETEHAEDEETGAEVRVVVEIRPERGHEELRIVVRDIREQPAKRAAARRAHGRAEVLMDDGTGAFETVAASRVRRGRLSVRFTTRRGRELPLGAESLRDLSGRALEIRLRGVRVASGALPQL